jgi:sugar phosphate permease
VGWPAECSLGLGWRDISGDGVLRMSDGDLARTEAIALAVITFASQGSLSIATTAFLALAPVICRELALTHSQIGLYTTCLYGGSLLAALGGGWFVDRFRVRLSFALGLGLVAILLAFLSVIPSFVGMMLVVAVLGIAQSVIVPAVNKSIMTLSSLARMRATLVGLMTSAIPVGGLCCFAALPILADRVGFRLAMGCSAIPAAGMALISLRFYRDPPHDVRRNRERIRWSEAVGLLREPSIVPTGLIGLLLGGVQFSVLGFFVLFLQEELGIPAIIGAVTMSIAQGVSIVARPLWGLGSDLFLQGSRTRIMAGILLLGAGCCGGFLFLGMAPSSRVLLSLVGGMIGLTIFSWPSIFNTILSECGGKDRAGIASGIGLAFVRAGILGIPPLAGLFIDRTGDYARLWLGIAAIMTAAGLLAIVRTRGEAKRRRSPVQI